MVWRGTLLLACIHNYGSNLKRRQLYGWCYYCHNSSWTIATIMASMCTQLQGVEQCMTRGDKSVKHGMKLNLLTSKTRDSYLHIHNSHYV